MAMKFTMKFKSTVIILLYYCQLHSAFYFNCANVTYEAIEDITGRLCFSVFLKLQTCNSFCHLKQILSENINEYYVNIFRETCFVYVRNFITSLEHTIYQRKKLAVADFEVTCR